MNQTAFEQTWLSTFAPQVTAAQREACYLSQYLWHLFSYRLLREGRFLEGEAARAAYDAADKEGAFVICLWNGDGESAPLPARLHRAKALERRPESYVVGRDWRWTYVSTHENGHCGPYFLLRDREG